MYQKRFDRLSDPEQSQMVCPIKYERRQKDIQTKVVEQHDR
jgi:hypothetical protein